MNPFETRTEFKQFQDFDTRKTIRRQKMSNPKQTATRANAKVSRADFFFFASLLFSIAILVAYIVHFSRPEFSGDDATNSFLAQAMYDQGTLIPRSWRVANGDMMFPSAAMLMAPLLCWLPNGFIVHAIAATILALALLASLGYFLRCARISWAATALIVMTLALGFSRVFIVMTYLETAYVWWPMAFFLLAALIVSDHMRARDGNFRKVALPLLILSTSLLISLKNPSRVAVMVLLPAFIFSRALAVFGKTGRMLAPLPRGLLSRHTLVRELAMLFGLALAFITVKFLTYSGMVTDYAAASNLHVTDAKGFWNHLKLFSSGWFEYFGAHAEEHANHTLEPVMRVFRTMIVGALTLNFLAELYEWRKNVNPVRRALIAAFLAAFFSILAIYLIFDPLAQDYITTRYFTLPYLILLALAGWRINDVLQRRGAFMPWALIAFCIISLVSGIQRMVPVDDSFARQSRPELLAAVLQEEGLKYGYGSWWNAGATTIMSDSKVRVLPVELSPSTIRPFPIMVDTNLYRRGPNSDSSFMVIADNELLQDQRDFLQEILGPAQREIVAGDARILVYDYDIANSFVCNGAAMNAPLPDEKFKQVKILAADMQNPTLADGRPRIKVRIRNESSLAISSEGSYPTTVGIHLLDKNGAMVNNDFHHASLGCPFAPGDDRTVRLTLPDIPRGDYQLEVELVQEGYAWFALKGGETKRIEVPMQR